MKAILQLPQSTYLEDDTCLQQILDEYIQTECGNVPLIQKYGQKAFKELCNLVAFVFPNATYQAYTLLQPFVFLLLVLDDLNPDSQPNDSALHEAYENLMRELMQHLQQTMSEEDFNMLQKSFASLLQLRKGKRNEETICSMSLKQFCKFRAEDSMALVGMRLIPLCCGIHLSDEIYSHPLIIKLEKIVSKHTAFANDILSYQREVKEEDTTVNLVAELMKRNKCSLTNAVLKTVHRCNLLVEKFENVAKQLLNEEKREGSTEEEKQVLVKYIQGLRNMMGGFVWFQIKCTSGRYSTIFDDLTVEVKVLV